MHTGRWRTFWRLFGTYAVLVIGSLIVLGWVVVRRVEQYELAQIDDQLRRKAAMIEEMTDDWSPPLLPLLRARIKTWGERMETRITLVGHDGRVLADSEEDAAVMENHANRPEIVQARQNGTGTATRWSNTVGQSMMYVGRRTAGDSLVGFVRVARPLDAIQTQLAELDRIVWGFAAATGIAVLALAFWLARRITRPLRDLTVGAERIAAGAYGHQVDPAHSDEFGTLARAFNTMSERLADQFRQLQEDRQQLRTVLSGMVEGVIAIDAAQCILFANERAGQLLDFSPDKVVGLKLWEVVRQRSIHEAIQRAVQHEEPYREEIDWNGSVVKGLALHVGRLGDSPSGGAVLVLRDTTELRRLERLRQDFVANVSHELKTPLAVIKASVETLLDGAMEDVSHRGGFLEQIEEQANRLHALILDLISLARIESGEQVFDLKAVCLERAVRESVERHRARAEAKNQRLEIIQPARRERGQVPPVAYAPGAPDRAPGAPDRAPGALFAWADEEAVAEILDNLIDNAIKYTPEGGLIRVRFDGTDEEVYLEVEDSGIGIPERDLPRVFERFYRVDRARSRELGGTGLGLSIVKHLVGAMNGTVMASSRLHQGSKFTVRLPRAPAT